MESVHAGQQVFVMGVLSLPAVGWCFPQDGWVTRWGWGGPQIYLGVSLGTPPGESSHLWWGEHTGCGHHTLAPGLHTGWLTGGNGAEFTCDQLMYGFNAQLNPLVDVLSGLLI